MNFRRKVGGNLRFRYNKIIVVFTPPSSLPSPHAASFTNTNKNNNDGEFIKKKLFYNC